MCGLLKILFIFSSTIVTKFGPVTKFGVAAKYSTKCSIDSVRVMYKIGWVGTRYDAVQKHGFSQMPNISKSRFKKKMSPWNSNLTIYHYVLLLLSMKFNICDICVAKATGNHGGPWTCALPS